MRFRSLEEICQMLVGTARSCGIEVIIESSYVDRQEHIKKVPNCKITNVKLFQIVHNLDPEEYGQFLADRKTVVEEQLQELKEKKEAKMLRA